MEMDEVEMVSAASERPEQENQTDGAEPESTVFYVTIPDFQELTEEKKRSNVHEFAGFKWRLLIFPRGNDAKSSISVYLECDGPIEENYPNTFTRWNKILAFKLILCSQEPDSRDITKEARHDFSNSETDWGFREFVPFETLYSIEESFIVDGAIKLGASLNVVAPVEYNSKKETGFNGIKNLGATCYMNSLLQTLYTIGDFRRSVFLMDLPEESEEDKIPFALQKVFYELQKGSTAVKTKKLTKSFGWDSSDAFTQQDMHELNRLLCSHLEDTMKKNGKNKISELFEGKLNCFIECVNVPYKSCREEKFFDLSLTVQGSRNIYESFDKYTEVQMLEGDNKYRAEGYEELQEARMGVKFSQLPPVLQLHLKRSEYDLLQETLVKINDRFEFPVELDLTRYVHNSDGSEIYLLHSVLVHVGDVHAGHYYVYIRPFSESEQWYKFDDETVTLVDEKEAVEENFGSPTWRKLSNAYMLQYIQKSKVHPILRKVENEDIPGSLEERIKIDAEEEDCRRREKDDMYLFMDVTIAREEMLSMDTGVDLVPWEKMVQDKRWLKKDMLLRELRNCLTTTLQVNSGMKIRLWRMTQRHNGTIRTDRLLTEADDDTPLCKLSGMGSELHLFVQQVPETEVDELQAGYIIQFFKIYSPKPTPVLSYVGSIICHRDWSLKQVLMHASDWQNLSPDVLRAITQGEASFFEEVTPRLIRPIEIDAPFSQSDIGEGGDIIVIQLPTTVNSLSLGSLVKVTPTPPLQGSRDLLTAEEYYNYLLNRIVVEFRDILKPHEKGIELELLKTDTYAETRHSLAQALGKGHDPDRIRLYPLDAVENCPRLEALSISNLRSRGDSLENMLEIDLRPTTYNGTDTRILWYEFTNYDLEEFEVKEEVRITWRYDSGTHVQGVSSAVTPAEKQQPWMRSKTISVLVPSDISTYADVVRELRDKIGLPEDLPLRLMEIKSSYIFRIIQLEETVPKGFQKQWNAAQTDPELRAEPDGLSDSDRQHIGSGEFSWVSVLHTPKGSQVNSRRGYFGDPFLLPVKNGGEKVGVLRERIRQKVRVQDEEFSSWKLASVSVSAMDFLEDMEAIWQPRSGQAEEISLAIEHRKIPPKRTYGLMKQGKPLVIKS